jgi:mannose-6-phosphate isomerase
MGGETGKSGLELGRRPWGIYEVLADEDDHKVKRITVFPGKRLSLQRHRRRSEHWFCVHGTGAVTLDDRVVEFTPGGAVDIGTGVLHRVENKGTDDLYFIEIQRGDYFGEDDIERVEDDFGRA